MSSLPSPQSLTPWERSTVDLEKDLRMGWISFSLKWTLAWLLVVPALLLLVGLTGYAPDLGVVFVTVLVGLAHITTQGFMDGLAQTREQRQEMREVLLCRTDIILMSGRLKGAFSRRALADDLDGVFTHRFEAFERQNARRLLERQIEILDEEGEFNFLGPECLVDWPSNDAGDDDLVFLDVPLHRPRPVVNTTVEVEDDFWARRPV